MSGKVTDKKIYTLSEIDTDRIFDDSVKTDIYWFKLKEGEKKGLEFAIPKSYPKYTDDVQSLLEKMSVGDTVRMSCESLNGRDTKWICRSIEEL